MSSIVQGSKWDIIGWYDRHLNVPDNFNYNSSHNLKEKYTLENGIEYISNQDYSASTKKVYINALKGVYTKLVETKYKNLASLIASTDNILKYHDKIPAKSLSMYIRVLTLIAEDMHNKKKITIEILEEYKKMRKWITISENFKSQSQELDSKQKEKWISYNGLEKLVHYLPPSPLKLFLGLNIYNPPLRSDYYTLIWKPFGHIEDLCCKNDNNNYITPTHIIMNKFKTSRAMGCIAIPLSYNSKIILKEYIDFKEQEYKTCLERKSGFCKRVKPLNDDSFLFGDEYSRSQNFIRAMNSSLNRYGISNFVYSSQIARHVYLTCNFKDISRLGPEHRNKLSKYMLHSTAMNRNYLLIDDGSSTCYTEIDKGKLGSKVMNTKIPSKFKSFTDNILTLF